MKKKKSLTLKWAEDLNTHFSKEEKASDQQVYVKMLNTGNHCDGLVTILCHVQLL